MEDTAAAPGPRTGDMRRAGLTVHLAAGPELPLASPCTSGHVRPAPVLGWALVLGWHWCGTGAGAGDCSALCPWRAGGRGAGRGRQPATRRLGRDFSWCSNEDRGLHCLLVKDCCVWVQGGHAYSMTIIPAPVSSGGAHKAVGQHPSLSPSPPAPHSTHLSSAVSQLKGCRGMLSSLCRGLAELPSPDQVQAPGHSSTRRLLSLPSLPPVVLTAPWPHQDPAADPPGPGHQQGHPATAAGPPSQSSSAGSHCPILFAACLPASQASRASCPVASS